MRLTLESSWISSTERSAAPRAAFRRCVLGTRSITLSGTLPRLEKAVLRLVGSSYSSNDRFALYLPRDHATLKPARLSL